jgi:hypothetical protein
LLLKDSWLPKLTKSSTDTDSPSAMRPNIEKLDPIRAKRRIEKELPMLP